MTAQLYFCPTAGEVEDPVHGGFDICCDRPDLHQPVCLHEVLLTDGCLKCGRTVSRRGIRVHREHTATCVTGWCEGRTDECDCWCHDPAPAA